MLSLTGNCAQQVFVKSIILLYCYISAWPSTQLSCIILIKAQQMPAANQCTSLIHGSVTMEDIHMTKLILCDETICLRQWLITCLTGFHEWCVVFKLLLLHAIPMVFMIMNCTFNVRMLYYDLLYLNIDRNCDVNITYHHMIIICNHIVIVLLFH